MYVLPVLNAVIFGSVGSLALTHVSQADFQNSDSPFTPLINAILFS